MLRKKEKPSAEIFSVSYVADEQRPRPARDVRLQRRPGSVVRVPARRRRRAAARRLPGRRDAAADAAAARAERRVVARVHRPRLRRPRRDGLQPDHREGRQEEGRREEGRRRAKGDEPDPKEYFGYKRDLESLSEFIGRWLSSNGRWGSPVFIAGESYGGYRVGRLVRILQETAGIGLNGAILISPALEISTLASGDYDVLRGSTCCRRWQARLRITAARARSARGTPLEDVQREAEAFATSDYTAFLTRGASMPAAERDRVLARLADLVGLPVELVTPCRGAYSDRRLRARAPARRAEGARALRRDDHGHRPVPGPRAVQRPRPDPGGHRVPRTRRRSTGCCAPRSASRRIASTRCSATRSTRSGRTTTSGTSSFRRWARPTTSATACR